MDDARSATMLRMLSRALRGAIGLVAILLGVGVFAYLANSAPTPERAENVDRSLVVRTLRLRPIEIPRVWDGYGTARAMNAVDIAAEITGIIAERPADIEAGRAVSQGQTILRLDPEDFQQRLEAQTQLAASLQAQLDGLDPREARLQEQLDFANQESDLAENEYKRALQALEQGAGNESEVEAKLGILRRAQRAAAQIAEQLDSMPPERASLKAQLANQKAMIRLTERDLERTTIASPINGLLQTVRGEEGELLAPGQVIARVVDLTRIEIPVRLPVSAGSSIVVGDRVELRTDSALDAEWEGNVIGIAPEADAATRSMTVFVEVRQDITDALRERRAVNTEGGRLLLPGQFVIARVVTADRKARFVVPRTAVQRDRVMVVTEGPEARARSVPVRVLFHIASEMAELDPVESQWAILDDTDKLREGDLVITSNLDEVAEGTPIRASDAIARDGHRGEGGL